MDKAIVKQVTIPTTLEQAWRCWTTKQGLESFFAPSCSIELWPGGLFEVHFFPDNPRAPVAPRTSRSSPFCPSGC